MVSDQPTLVFSLLNPTVLDACQPQYHEVYFNERFTRSDALTYSVPVPAVGSYVVKTLHSELFYEKPGARVFSVEVNGNVTFRNVDLYKIRGKKFALQLGHRVEMGEAGDITIKFLKVTGNPQVNAIVVSGCKRIGSDFLTPRKINVGGGAVAGYEADKIGYKCNNPRY